MVIALILLLISIGASLCLIFLTPLFAISPFFLLLLILFIPVCFLLSTVVATLLVALYSLFINKNKEIKKPSRFTLWLTQQVLFLVMFYAHITYTVNGLEKLPKDKTFLLVQNHLSKFDQVFAIYALRHYPILWVTKPENLTMPVVGKIARKDGYIAIDRNDPYEGVKSIRKAANYIKEGTYSIGICPEGTRSPDHQLHDFKAGSFKIATWGQCPLVIMVVRNTYKVAENVRKMKFTHCYLDIIEVIPYGEIKNLSTIEISELAHNKIEEFLKEHPA